MSTDPPDPRESQARPGAAQVVEGPASFDTSGSLATQQVEMMVAAWRRGERPLAEDILARHPELGDEAAIRLIYEEVALRQEVGLARVSYSGLPSGCTRISDFGLKSLASSVWAVRNPRVNRCS